MLVSAVPTTRRSLFRRSAAVLGSSGAIAALAACNQESAPAVSKDTNAKLTWFIWSTNNGVRGEAYNAITNTFQQEYPNVTVEQISGGGNLKNVMEKLITMIAGDEPLDLVGIRHDVLPQYVSTGILKDLSSLTRRDNSFKVADHMATAVDMLSWKGRLYGMPIGMSTSAIAYNGALFQKAGVKVPDGSWNWRGYLETAQRLTDKSGDEPIWGTHILPSSSEIFYWIWMNGGEPFTPKEDPRQAKFSAPAVLEAVEWFIDLNRRYGVKAPADHPDGKGSNGKFEQGRLAFFPVQTNNTRELQDEQFPWDVVALPAGRNKPVYPLSSFSYGLFNNTKHPDLAWKFWTTAVGSTGQREWMLKTGEFIPSHKSLHDEYVRMSLRPESKKVFLNAAANGRPTPKMPKWSEISPIINEQLVAADTGKVGVKAALETMDRLISPLLAQQ